MFLLRRVFQKPKGLSVADETPQQHPRPDVSPRSTIFDATRSIRVDAQPGGTISEIESSSPVIKGLSADDNRELDASNPERLPIALSTQLAAQMDATDGIRSTDLRESGPHPQPPSPTVIDESTMNGILLSGQSDVYHSVLSACDDLPSLPGAMEVLLRPRYMPTDPSPLALPTTFHFPGEPPTTVEDTLRLGGFVKVVVDGQEFMGTVMEIIRVNGERGFPGEYNRRKPPILRPNVLPPAFHETWHEDDHVDDQMSAVRKWVNGQLEPYPASDNMTKGQETNASSTGAKLDPVPGVTGASNNGPDPGSYVLDQPFRAAASQQPPSLNHTSGVDTTLVQLGKSSPPEALAKSIQDGGRGQVIVFEIPQWRHTKIDPDKPYQCGGVLGKGSFGKVLPGYYSFQPCLCFNQGVSRSSHTG
jgi:hypothetical protein